MSPQQVVALSLRLFAIWLSLWAIRYITFVPDSLIKNHIDSGVDLAYYIGFGTMCIAFIIWFFPMTIANKIISKSSSDHSFNTNPNEVALVGISILGLWKIIDSAPVLASSLFQAYLNSGSRPLFSSLDAAGKTDIVFMFIELFIAVILVVQAKKIAHFIMKSYVN